MGDKAKYSLSQVNSKSANFMKECPECGKETEKLYSQEYVDPKTKRQEQIFVCAECKVKFDNLYKKIAKSARDFQKQIHRKMYEEKGDIENLK